MNENGVVNVYLLIISFVLAPNSEAEDIINVDEEMPVLSQETVVHLHVAGHQYVQK